MDVPELGRNAGRCREGRNITASGSLLAMPAASMCLYVMEAPCRYGGGQKAWRKIRATLYKVDWTSQIC